MKSKRPESGDETAQALVMAFAKDVGLRYVRDTSPGIKRKRAGKGFSYVDHQNSKVTCPKILSRIKGLVIPPAWQSVWICTVANGHLQATGRDARGRKQYRYHEEWSRARNETKFDKLIEFGDELALIRHRVDEDLRLPGFTREKILAAVVRTMELTKIRVGNDIYALENESYGLTTIRNHHAQIQGSKVQFSFKGKSGVQHKISFSHPQLSRIIRKCQDLPGEELFAYEDEDGSPRDVGSADVNEYLRSITQNTITAKDFRTWGATVKAVETLVELGPQKSETKKALKERHLEVLESAAQHLGNTVAVCRKYYVHPAVFISDQEGFLHNRKKKKIRARPSLTESECLTLEVLRQYGFPARPK